MKRFATTAMIALGLLVLTGCSPFGPGLTGDPLPSAVDLRSVPSGGHVERAAEVDGVTYYLVDEGESSMCIVHYASDADWTAGCGGPSVTVGSRGSTVAWFEDDAPTDDWAKLGGGLWIKS